MVMHIFFLGDTRIELNMILHNLFYVMLLQARVLAWPESPEVPQAFCISYCDFCSTLSNLGSIIQKPFLQYPGGLQNQKIQLFGKLISNLINLSSLCQLCYKIMLRSCIEMRVCRLLINSCYSCDVFMSEICLFPMLYLREDSNKC